MSEFTKGPWKYEEKGRSSGRIFGADGVGVCNFGTVGMWEQSAGCSPSDEDLALILAAPSLYHALKEAIVTIHTESNASILERCRAALALAEGKAVAQ